MKELVRLFRYLFQNRSGAVFKRLQQDWLHEYGRQRPGKLEVVKIKELFRFPTKSIRYLNLDKFYRSEEHIYKLAPYQSQENTQHLCLLISYLAPARILEIGTHLGLTTVNMHMNAPENCQFHTVDIEPLVAQDPFISAYFKAHGINLHAMKSEEFAQSYSGQFDFIFIDGDHTFEGVKRDTELALKLLAPDGTIVWDDYAFDLTPEITRYLEELPKELGIRKIDQTTLAIKSSGLIK